MGRKMSLIAIALAVTGSTHAQTTVTNSNNGTTGSVPVYTGTATLSGTSVITQSGSYLGIGTTSPTHPVDIDTIADPTQLSTANLYTFVSINSATSNAIHYWNAASGLVYLTLSSNKLTGLDNGLNVFTAGYELTGSGNLGAVAIYNACGNTYTTSKSIVDSIAAFQADLPSNYSNGTTTISKYYGLFLGGLTSTGYVTQGYGVYQTGTSDLNYFAGKVGVGTASPAYLLGVAGTIRSSTGGVVYPDGTSQTTAWTEILCGGDYAEDMNVAGGKAKYEPGDVLVLTSGNEDDVGKSAEPYSTMVAGIYATKPGVVGRRAALADSKNDIPMAMVGVVPTKVSTENGAIHRGDLLVSSSTRGYAMKGTDRSRLVGAMIGKAMGSLNSGTGIIEMLVTLQ